MSELCLGMVADDLTGACDTGAPFAARGLPTLVLLAGGETIDLPADLCVISTDSRADTPEVACDKVRRACRLLQTRGASLFYKKLDSTLKGNIAAEIDAALEVGGHPFALVAPAFPAMGRTLIGGRLQVHQVDTGIDLAAMLAGLRASVADAVTDDDLAALARAAWTQNPRPLLVGSGGLARHIAAGLGRTPGGSLDVAATPRPVAIVVGSENPVTAAQRERVPAGHRVYRIDWADPGALSGLVSDLESRALAGLFCCGGDTAALVCGLLETPAIFLEGEVRIGLPWGRLVGGRAPGLPIVTKAGGFGAPDAVAAAVGFLSRLPERHSR